MQIQSPLLFCLIISNQSTLCNYYSYYGDFVNSHKPTTAFSLIQERLILLEKRYKELDMKIYDSKCIHSTITLHQQKYPKLILNELRISLTIFFLPTVHYCIRFRYLVIAKCYTATIFPVFAWLQHCLRQQTIIILK